MAVSRVFNAYAKNGKIDDAFKELESYGAKGVIALLRHTDAYQQSAFSIFAQQWIVKRAREDSSVAHALVALLDQEYSGELAARILGNGGPNVAEPALDLLEKTHEPVSPKEAMDATAAKLARERTKHVLSLLEGGTPAVSQRFQKEALRIRGTESTPFSVDMAYVLCWRAEGLAELSKIIRARPKERTYRSVLGAMDMALNEAGNDLLGLNEGGDRMETAWRGLFASFRTEPGWNSLVDPVEKKFNAISEHRKQRMKELSDKKKQAWVPDSIRDHARSSSYALTMASTPNRRFALERPSSDNRERSEWSNTREMASARARSSLARAMRQS